MKRVTFETLPSRGFHPLVETPTNPECWFTSGLAQKSNFCPCTICSKQMRDLAWSYLDQQDDKQITQRKIIEHQEDCSIQGHTRALTQVNYIQALQSHSIQDKGPGNWAVALVTINPPPTSNPQIISKQLVNGFTKMTQREISANLDLVGVLEQRSDTPNVYDGVHMHLVIRRVTKTSNSNPKKIKEAIFESFKHISPILQSYNIKYGPAASLKNFLTYILGQKSDTDKHAKQANDVYFRLEYEIPHPMVWRAHQEIQN